MDLLSQSKMTWSVFPISPTDILSVHRRVTPVLLVLLALLVKTDLRAFVVMPVSREDRETVGSVDPQEHMERRERLERMDLL